MKRLLTILSVLAISAFGLAACGGGDDESSSTSAASTTTSTSSSAGGGASGGGGTVKFEADPSGQLAYTSDTATAKAGDVTIEFDNPASLGHDVVIEDADGNEIARTDVITDDSTSTNATLEAGEYTFFCSVDAHRDAGMEGTLTVSG